MNTRMRHQLIMHHASLQLHVVRNISSPIELFRLSIVEAQAAVLHLIAVHHGGGERTSWQNAPNNV